jgi:putative transposase
MPRSPRIDFPGLAQHLIVRGNNRGLLFRDDIDRQLFMRHLMEALEKNPVNLHAYVFMSNHVHLLATGQEPFALSRSVQAVGRRYSRYFNRRHHRTGTLFEGRFRSSLVESQRYVMACMRYIELNPVRAGMVAAPDDHPWSSFHENASGEPSRFVTPHAEYLRLGEDAATRARVYRDLMRTGVTAAELAMLREHAQKSRAVGSEDFLRGVEATLGRTVRIVKPGHQPRGMACSVPFGRAKVI